VSCLAQPLLPTDRHEPAIFIRHKVIRHLRAAIVAKHPDTEESNRQEFADLLTDSKKHFAAIANGEKGIIDGKLHGGMGFPLTEFVVSKGVADSHGNGGGNGCQEVALALAPLFFIAGNKIQKPYDLPARKKRGKHNLAHARVVKNFQNGVGVVAMALQLITNADRCNRWLCQEGLEP